MIQYNSSSHSGLKVCAGFGHDFGQIIFKLFSFLLSKVLEEQNPKASVQRSVVEVGGGWWGGLGRRQLNR